MDALLLMSIFRFYPGLKLSFQHKSVRKNLLWSMFLLGILDFLCLRWTQKLYLVKPLDMVTRTCNFYSVNWKYLDYMEN